MKTIIFGVTFLIITIRACISTKPSPFEYPYVEFEIDTSMINIINSKMLDYPEGAEVSIAITKGDSISYYGATRKNEKIECLRNRNTIFEIGSISKVFTSHLLINSVLRKEIQLNEPISGYFDFELEDKGNITFLQLASHTSGLPAMPESFFKNLVDTLNPYRGYSKEQMLFDFENEIEIDSGSVGKFQYSNFGVALLGHILANERRLTYEELLQEEILRPLLMAQTTTNKENLKRSVAKGMLFDGTLVPSWDLNSITPAGGILSNSEDLAKYAINCYSSANNTFPLQSELVLQKTKRSAQATGWMIINSKSGNHYFYHAGETGGYTCILIVRPAMKKAVVLLSNISEANGAVEKLGFKLMKELIELE